MSAAAAAGLSGEDRYRSLFENALEGMFQSTIDGQALIVNPAFARVLGYSSVEQFLAEVTDIRATWVDPEQRRRLLARLREEHSVTGFEYRCYRRDGSIIWLSMSAQALLDDHGEMVGLQGMEIDITKQKEDEAERERLQQQLLQAQKMEAVGKLAGGIAHDFNNLLAIIINYTCFLADDMHADDPKRADLNEVQYAAQRAAALVRQLLAFSRKEVVSPKVVDANVLVRSMHQLLSRTIGSNVCLSVDLADDLRLTKIDPGQLEQVIVNLVVNGRDAMPKGGRLVIRTRNHRLDESFVRAHPGSSVGDHVRLSVIDEGSGIAPDAVGRIFEPFFTTKRRGEGTGLGLSMVYGIVKQAGGYIAVTSREGRGATFDVYLPVTDEPPDADHAEDMQPRRPGQGEVVLVAEDEPGVRRLMERILSANGYEVLVARDGEQALTLAELTSPIDLLVTDVMMPGLLGKDLVDEISKLQGPTKTLYVSGYTESFAHAPLRKTERYLSKPFTAAQLLDAVAEILRPSSGT